jgi:hypothetical protein
MTRPRCVSFKQAKHLSREVQGGKAMNYSLRVCIAFMFSLLFMHSFAAAEPAGKVLSAKKEVSSAGTGGKKSLQPNDPVFLMDRLSTNATGTGEFLFNDGTKLAIGPSASLVVDEFVQKNRSTVSKLGVAASKGTFRWISGKSPPKAYRIKTPRGTMAIRGTALEVSTVDGVTHVLLLEGEAEFCEDENENENENNGSGCVVLSNPCEYIAIGGEGISEKKDVKEAFKNRQEAAKIFPLQDDSRSLSSEFQVPGVSCLSGMASNSQNIPALAAAAVVVGVAVVPPSLEGEEDDDSPVTPQ